MMRFVGSVTIRDGLIEVRDNQWNECSGDKTQALSRLLRN